MARPSFLEVQKRLKFLIGEDGSTGADSTTTGATQKSHINAAINDIVNQSPFSWNVATTDLTVASGVSDLPADFNPKWGIEDARIEGTYDGDYDLFTYVPIPSRDQGVDEYVYWITYDTTSDVYVFNTNQDAGTVKIYYHFTPAALTGDTDVCQVPDQEAVAYHAGYKHWISDERNEEMAKMFKQEAGQRISALYIQDLNFGPSYSQGNPAQYETQLTGE